MWVDADINEIDLSQVKIGQKAIITFNQLNNLTLKGTVKFVNPAAISQSGLTVIPIEIAFDKDPSKYGIIPGLDCNVLLNIGTSKGVLVPSGAIFIDPKGSKYVLIKTSSGLERSYVTVGNQTPTMTEILKGVKDGDVLIVQVSSQFTQQTTTIQGAFRAFSGGK